MIDIFMTTGSLVTLGLIMFSPRFCKWLEAKLATFFTVLIIALLLGAFLGIFGWFIGAIISLFAFLG